MTATASGDQEVEVGATPSASAKARRRGRPRRSRRESGLTTTQLWVWRVLLLVAFFGLWQIASGRFISGLLISQPSSIASAFWGWTTDGTLWRNLWVTGQATFLGFLLGAFAGMIAGYVTASFRKIGEILEPGMTALYTLPRLALAPLFLLWFGLGMQFRVIFAATIVFFLVYFNTHFGVRDVQTELIAAVRLMGANRWTLATKVVLPSALVWVVAGFKMSVPYALIGVVVGEMLASNEGLGYLLATSSNQFNSAGTFAAIAALLIVALVLDHTLTRLTKRYLRWRSAGALHV